MEQNIIGTTIAALRREKGLTQDALAAQLGVSAQAVSKWENGLSCPDILMLPEIAEFFDVSVDALFGRESTNAAVPAPVENVVYHDLPWSDDERTLHAVLFLGHKLVGHTPFSRGTRERANVTWSFIMTAPRLISRAISPSRAARTRPSRAASTQATA